MEFSDFPLVSEITRIMDGNVMPRGNVDEVFRMPDTDRVHGVDRLKTWIQKFRDQNVPVDINRIVRYAISADRNDLVKYLVEDEGASLQQKDKFGRSTVFYAAAMIRPDMLGYIHGEMCDEIFGEEMNHQDEHKRIPCYYAAMVSSLGSVEYCLAAGARPADDDIWETKLADPHGLDKQIALLLTLYTRLKSYLKFPVYAESFKSEKERDRALSTIDSFLSDTEPLTKWQNISSERTLTWIHIPWTNVS